eukprot:313888_1
MLFYRKFFSTIVKNNRGGERLHGYIYNALAEMTTLNQSPQSNKLIPTIPTVVGMVINYGKPRQRNLPNLDNCKNLQWGNNTKPPLKIPNEIVCYDYNNKTQPSSNMIELFYQCIINRTLPIQPHDSDISTWGWISSTFSTLFNANYNANIIARLVGNIYACTRSNVSCNDLKQYIRSNKRIDIEQAVGLIISLLLNSTDGKYNELINKLLIQCGEILFNSFMWLDEQKDNTTGLTINENKYKRFLYKFNNYYKDVTNNCKIRNLSEMYILLQILRRIRHSNAINKSQRCLRIPDILYEYIGIIKPQQDEYDIDNPTMSWPERSNDEINVIYIGRRKFNRLNRQLRCLQGKFKFGSELRRKIWKLKDKMKCNNVTAINNTNDILSLCFSFLSFQRHCQLKIVSNIQSDTFLKKGESKIWFQNNPLQLSTFENILVDAALKQNINKLDLKALTAVITPPQVFECKIENENKEGEEEQQLDIGWNWEQYVKYIDETALLMEEYIIIHGDGSFDKLCYKKNVSGGSRGPVDDYNLLCDIMKTYVKRYEDAMKQFEINHKNNLKYLRNDNYGYYYIFKYLPQINHKFLAKDIMAWNDGWKDDAFANGKRPDWVKWLKFRRSNGVIAPTKQKCY